MNVYEKLYEVQQNLKAPKSRFNKFGNYSYRNCEDILDGVKKTIAELDLKAVVIITDDIEEVEGRYYVVSTATFVDCESGEKVSSWARAREPQTKKGMDDAQLTGATSSYCRKYALNGLFAIDDAKDADSDEFASVSGSSKANEVKKETVTKIDNGIEKLCDELKKFIDVHAKEKKITKKKALDVLRKHGIDSPALLKSKEQYDEIMTDLKKTIEE